jgi:pyruvate/2-oxoglutarate dehydrogenase complex dihydrolipoamide dehydrogenase (E3) component
MTWWVPLIRALVAEYKLSGVEQIVIGSGPAAQKCAVDSSKRGKKVAVVDKQAMHGGVAVHNGTIPSKTFREAILHLTGYRHQGVCVPRWIG